MCVCVCVCVDLYLIRIQYIEWNKIVSFLPFGRRRRLKGESGVWTTQIPPGRFVVVVKGTSTVRVSGLYHTSPSQYV